MSPLLGLTRLDRQRNTDIHNRLKVYTIVQDMQLYQKKWYEWTEAAYRGWLSSRPTNLGDGGTWEDLDEDGETKNTFKGTCVKDLNLDYVHDDVSRP
jgi:hypothetical protein